MLYGKLPARRYGSSLFSRSRGLTSSASPWITSTFVPEYCSRNCSARLSSSSIAMTRWAHDASACVSTPVPGPISITVSLLAGVRAFVMRETTVLSMRKCCPSDFFAVRRNGGRLRGLAEDCFDDDVGVKTDETAGYQASQPQSITA